MLLVAHDRLPGDRQAGELAIDAAIAVPPASDLDLMRHDGRTDLASALLAGPARDLYPICHVPSPLWGCMSTWQFAEVMTACLCDPELMEYACRRYLALSLHCVERAARLGAQGMWIEECMTDMISPELFARLNLPWLRAVVEAIRRLGMKSIYYYCGNPHGRWELIMESGADALALEETKKTFTIDVAEVVARVGGRMTVLGNLDAIGMLQDAPESRLRAEIERQVAAGRRNGRRFIVSLGSPVTPATPVPRVRRYCDLVHEIGAR